MTLRNLKLNNIPQIRIYLQPCKVAIQRKRIVVVAFNYLYNILFRNIYMDDINEALNVVEEWGCYVL